MRVDRRIFEVAPGDGRFLIALTGICLASRPDSPFRNPHPAICCPRQPRDRLRCAGPRACRETTSCPARRPTLLTTMTTVHCYGGRRHHSRAGRTLVFAINRRMFLKRCRRNLDSHSDAWFTSSCRPRIRTGTSRIREARYPANDHIQIALIGAGGQGQGDTTAAVQVPGVKLVAVADCYDGRLDTARRSGETTSSPRATTARSSRAKTSTRSLSARPTTGTSGPLSTR